MPPGVAGGAGAPVARRASRGAVGSGRLGAGRLRLTGPGKSLRDRLRRCTHPPGAVGVVGLDRRVSLSVGGPAGQRDRPPRRAGRCRGGRRTWSSARRGPCAAGSGRSPAAGAGRLVDHHQEVAARTAGPARLGGVKPVRGSTAWLCASSTQVPVRARSGRISCQFGLPSPSRTARLVADDEHEVAARVVAQQGDLGVGCVAGGTVEEVLGDAPAQRLALRGHHHHAVLDRFPDDPTGRCGHPAHAVASAPEGAPRAPGSTRPPAESPFPASPEPPRRQVCGRRVAALLPRRGPATRRPTLVPDHLRRCGRELDDLGGRLDESLRLHRRALPRREIRARFDGGDLLHERHRDDHERAEHLHVAVDPDALLDPVGRPHQPASPRRHRPASAPTPGSAAPMIAVMSRAVCRSHCEVAARDPPTAGCGWRPRRRRHRRRRRGRPRPGPRPRGEATPAATARLSSRCQVRAVASGWARRWSGTGSPCRPLLAGSRAAGCRSRRGRTGMVPAKSSRAPRIAAAAPAAPARCSSPRSGRDARRRTVDQHPVLPAAVLSSASASSAVTGSTRPSASGTKASGAGSSRP